MNDLLEKNIYNVLADLSKDLIIANENLKISKISSDESADELKKYENTDLHDRYAIAYNYSMHITKKCTELTECIMLHISKIEPIVNKVRIRENAKMNIDFLYGQAAIISGEIYALYSTKPNECHNDIDDFIVELTQHQKKIKEYQSCLITVKKEINDITTADVNYKYANRIIREEIIASKNKYFDSVL